jgi:hypothetical protein
MSKTPLPKIRKTGLDPRIFAKLEKKLKGKVAIDSIRPLISKVRRDNPSLTLNAAAEVFAKKHGESVHRYLNEKDRDSLKTEPIIVKIPSSKPRPGKEIIVIARYDTNDKWLKAHLDEINKTYTHGCYTATFILCRKVLENLIIHHILRRKYPDRSRQHREKYLDFSKNRYLDFEKILTNFRNSSTDFLPEKNLAERICELAEGFKEKANDMTHSLYHIATRKEIDEKNFQQILDLVATLEKTLLTTH